jgi:hypothetical protein
MRQRGVSVILQSVVFRITVLASADEKGFYSSGLVPRDRMVAKDVIKTLIAGPSELIGMTSFRSSGPTCSQIIKETKS